MGTDYDWTDHAGPFADSKDTIESGDDAHSVGESIPRLDVDTRGSISSA